MDVYFALRKWDLDVFSLELANDPCVQIAPHLQTAVESGPESNRKLECAFTNLIESDQWRGNIFHIWVRGNDAFEDSEDPDGVCTVSGTDSDIGAPVVIGQGPIDYGLRDKV